MAPTTPQWGWLAEMLYRLDPLTGQCHPGTCWLAAMDAARALYLDATTVEQCRFIVGYYGLDT